MAVKMNIRKNFPVFFFSLVKSPPNPLIIQSSSFYQMNLICLSSSIKLKYVAPVHFICLWILCFSFLYLRNTKHSFSYNTPHHEEFHLHIKFFYFVCISLNSLMIIWLNIKIQNFWCCSRMSLCFIIINILFKYGSKCVHLWILLWTTERYIWSFVDAMNSVFAN